MFVFRYDGMDKPIRDVREVPESRLRKEKNIQIPADISKQELLYLAGISGITLHLGSNWAEGPAAAQERERVCALFPKEVKAGIHYQGRGNFILPNVEKAKSLDIQWAHEVILPRLLELGDGSFSDNEYSCRQLVVAPKLTKVSRNLSVCAKHVEFPEVSVIAEIFSTGGPWRFRGTESHRQRMENAYSVVMPALEIAGAISTNAKDFKTPKLRRIEGDCNIGPYAYDYGKYAYDADFPLLEYIAGNMAMHCGIADLPLLEGVGGKMVLHANTVKAPKLDLKNVKGGYTPDPYTYSVQFKGKAPRLRAGRSWSTAIEAPGWTRPSAHAPNGLMQPFP